MKVLILGGTGSIGSAVTQALVQAGHEITGLCRSPQSASRLSTLGARAVPGDLAQPQQWVHAVQDADAVIQTAATFGPDMAAADAAAVRAILAAAAGRQQKLRFLYTGGCWLYGATGDRIADENSPFRPIQPFAWMVKHGQQILSAPGVSAAIIHPAMVYHCGGGVFDRFLDQARGGQPIEIWGSIATRWPLVHRDDLAQAYRLLLERPELTGHFNASAETGVAVYDIVNEIAARAGHGGGYLVRTLKQALFAHGEWAEGPCLDQQMQARKLRRLCGWTPRYTRFQQAGF